MKTKAVRLYGKTDLRLEEFELPPMREDEISVADFGTLPTRVLPLSAETIAQNTAVTAGGDSSLVPRFAATMGMAPILAARR